MTTDFHTRALTLVMQEGEWRALREAEPDPIGWLKEQVRRRLEGAAQPVASAAGAEQMRSDTGTRSS